MPMPLIPTVPYAIGTDWVREHLRESHPRLIARPDTWSAITTRRQSDAAFDTRVGRLLGDARRLLDRPPVERVLIGRRLLDKSREALRRVQVLALAYRLGEGEAYRERLEAELRAVLAFDDWNPSHFLDVAEMAAAVALGLDWLHDEWTKAFREALRDGLHRHALRFVFEPDPDRHNTGVNGTNNWNSVCFAGLTMAVLATAEHQPDRTAAWLNRVLSDNPRSLYVLQPDGVYPEGPSYWGYGVVFQVMLIDSLTTALGTDFGLSEERGFLDTARFMRQITGPTGSPFNFADANRSKEGQIPLFWFAHRTGETSLAEDEARAAADAASPRADRLLTLGTVWWSRLDEIRPAAAELPRYWLGRGEQPVAVFRSAWGDPDAAFLATKGGKATLSHGHMDAGSFVLDALGVRWAEDLGAQDYESLESKGFTQLFHLTQDSQRWTVYRLNNFSHNTLTIDGHLHRADGQATVTAFDGDGGVGSVTYDLSAVFVGDAMRVERTFRFKPDVGVTIDDVAEGVRPGATVRWTMLNRAAVELAGGEATLTQDGRTLRAAITSPAGAAFEVRPAEPDPPTDYDAPNPGVQRLMVEVPAPESGRVELRVTLGWGG